MDVSIRTIAPEELREYFAVVETAFGGHLTTAFLEFHGPHVELDRAHAAFDDGAVVGAAGVSSFAMTVPGGEVRAAGVTGVGVLPTHRRRGINTALMRTQLDDVARRGEPVAVLYASQGSIYGRYGYGLASRNASIDVETARSSFGPWYERSGSVRLVERDEAVVAFQPVYDLVRRSRPGMMRLDRDAFAYRLDDRFRDDGKEQPGFLAAHETDGVVDGYVQYRVRQDWDVVPRNELMVDDLVATGGGAYADLWRHVLDADLMFRVTAWNRPPDDPLFDLVLEPRPLQFRLKDALWLRIVDVESALSSRAYRAESSIVLEVRDGFRPETSGTYEVVAEPGGASCRRTDRAPDLVLGVAELGAAYLGGTRVAALARARRVEERTPGAVERADAMFAWDPAPWCSFMF